MKKAELESGLNELKDTVHSITGVLGSVVSILDEIRKGQVAPMPSTPKTSPKVTAPPVPAKEKKASTLHLPVTLVLEVNLNADGEPLLSSSGKSVSFKVPAAAPLAVGQNLWVKRESFGDSIPDELTLTIK